MEGEHHSGALFGPGKAGEWDAAGCAHARTMVAAPRDLRLFYASPDAATGAWAIGSARSADGLAWKKAGAILSCFVASQALQMLTLSSQAAFSSAARLARGTRGA